MKNIFLLATLATFTTLSYGQGHADSVQYAIGLMTGNQGKVNYEEALPILCKYAEAGDANALNALGNTYKLGLGVNQDEDKALLYWTQAANIGLGKAWVNLGYMYGKEPNKFHDLNKSQECFLKAIECGCFEAYYPAACNLYKGVGTEVNYNKAFELYEISAKKSMPESMFMLGVCYMYGQGTDCNYVLAEEWLENARLYGVREAANQLNMLDSLKMQIQTSSFGLTIVECNDGGRMVVEFSLPDKAHCALQISSSLIGGNIVTQDLGHLLAGKHQVTLNASLQSGIYVLNLIADNMSSSLTFYKK